MTWRGVRPDGGFIVLPSCSYLRSCLVGVVYWQAGRTEDSPTWRIRHGTLSWGRVGVRQDDDYARPVSGGTFPGFLERPIGFKRIGMGDKA